MKIGVLGIILAGWLVIGAGMAGEASLLMAKLDNPEEQIATAAQLNPWNDLDPKELKLRSEAVLVVDPEGEVVYAKNADAPRPIASITKLMTAMVVLDHKLPLDQSITITKDDRDLIKLTGSRLIKGATLARKEVLQLALMASENRAANALARTYPNGREAFVEAMNAKATSLGMKHSRFIDPAGLDPNNVASARDVVAMLHAAQGYPLIEQATTTREMTVHPFKTRGPLRFVNTNRLMKNDKWKIELSKTGYSNEAGRCLAMQAAIAEHSLTIVFLDSFGKLTPFGDSNRLRHWIENGL